MKTQIIMNRVNKTVTVTGDMPVFADKRADESRATLLDLVSSYYASVLDCNGVDNPSIDKFEKAIAYIAETIATTSAGYINTISGWHSKMTEHTIAELTKSFVTYGYAYIGYYDTKIDNPAANDRAAAVEEPQKPVILDGYWNGTIYGSARKGYSVYVNNERISLTDSDKAEIEAYTAAAEAYKTAKDEAARNTPYTVITTETEETETAPAEDDTIDTHGLNINVSALRYVSEKTRACNDYVRGTIYYSPDTGAVIINRWIAGESPEPEFKKPDSMFGVASCYHYMTPQKIADYIAETVKMNSMSHDELWNYMGSCFDALTDKISSHNAEAKGAVKS